MRLLLMRLDRRGVHGHGSGVPRLRLRLTERGVIAAARLSLSLSRSLSRILPVSMNVCAKHGRRLPHLHPRICARATTRRLPRSLRGVLAVQVQYEREEQRDGGCSGVAVAFRPELRLRRAEISRAPGLAPRAAVLRRDGRRGDVRIIRGPDDDLHVGVHERDPADGVAVSLRSLVVVKVRGWRGQFLCPPIRTRGQRRFHALVGVVGLLHERDLL
mmetsp:Transcript_5203/g.13975  ORF Transcript_5203/g.13975 Transcript_5203/m.13975 type:complete len:216 (+) Transcript_5203:90-737(+)